MASLDVSNKRCLNALSFMGITSIERIYFLGIYPVLIGLGLIGNIINLLAIVINVLNQRRRDRSRNMGRINGTGSRMGIRRRIGTTCRKICTRPLLPDPSISIRDLESTGTTTYSQHEYFGLPSHSPKTVLGTKVFMISLFLVNILILCLLGVDPVLKHYVRGQGDPILFTNVWFSLVWNEFEANYHHPMDQALICVSFLISVLICFYIYARSLNRFHFYVNFFTTGNCQLLVLGCFLCSLVMFAPTTFWFKIVEIKLCPESLQKYQPRPKPNLGKSIYDSFSDNLQGISSPKGAFPDNREGIYNFSKHTWPGSGITKNNDTYDEGTFLKSPSILKGNRDKNIGNFFNIKSGTKPKSIVGLQVPPKFYLAVNNAFKYKTIVWSIYNTLRELLTKIAPITYLIYLNIQLVRSRRKVMWHEGLIDSLSYISGTNSGNTENKLKICNADRTFSTPDMRSGTPMSVKPISGKNSNLDITTPSLSKPLSLNAISVNGGNRLSVSMTRLVGKSPHPRMKQRTALSYFARKNVIQGRSRRKSHIPSPLVKRSNLSRMTRKSLHPPKGDPVLITFGTSVLLFQALLFLLPHTIINLFWDHVEKLSSYDLVKVEIVYELCQVLYVSLTFYLAMIFCPKYRKIIFDSFH